MKPSCCLSDLVREVKKSSNDFIKEKKFKFNWQEGYGAFSYSHSQIDSVIKYIKLAIMTGNPEVGWHNRSTKKTKQKPRRV
jgi:hypothetical protein